MCRLCATVRVPLLTTRYLSEIRSCIVLQILRSHASVDLGLTSRIGRRSRALKGRSLNSRRFQPAGQKLSYSLSKTTLKESNVLFPAQPLVDPVRVQNRLLTFVSVG